MPKETSLFSILHNVGEVTRNSKIVVTARLKKEIAIGISRAIQALHER